MSTQLTLEDVTFLKEYYACPQRIKEHVPSGPQWELMPDCVTTSVNLCASPRVLAHGGCVDAPFHEWQVPVKKNAEKGTCLSGNALGHGFIFYSSSL